MRIDLWNEVSSNGQRPYIETSLLPASYGPRPLIVVCPGGGYTHFGRYEGLPVARRFNELGFHAVVLEYRIKPTKFPEPTQDLLRAIRIVRRNAEAWGVIPDQIAALGFSAGGHLAASAAVYHSRVNADAGDEADKFSARPDALILCYAALSANEEFGNPGLAKTLSGSGEADPAVRALVSIDEHITPEFPPSFLWQTATDDAVNCLTALDFAKRLWKVGVKAALHIFPEGPHGTGLAEKLPDARHWPELAAEFLRTSCKFEA